MFSGENFGGFWGGKPFARGGKVERGEFGNRVKKVAGVKKPLGGGEKKGVGKDKKKRARGRA